MEQSPLRVIKPLVVPAQYFVFAPLISGFVSCFPGMFAFIISNMLSSNHFQPEFGVGVTVYILAFCTMMALLWVKMTKEPVWTTYTIYPDRIEYDEGFWNRHRRTLIFDQIIDVELVEGILQQSQGVGTITLVTQQLIAMGEGKLSNRRIALTNVPQPKAVYDLIRSLKLKKNES